MKFTKENEDGTIRLNLKLIGLIAGGVSASVSIIIAMWGFHGWIGTHVGHYFISKAEAGELTQQISKLANAAQQTSDAATATAKALDLHIKAEELKEQRRKLDDLKKRLQDVELWEQANKPTPFSTNTKRDLKFEIEHQAEYVACLQGGGHNCVQ